jgi:hypothetical protein
MEAYHAQEKGSIENNEFTNEETPYIKHALDESHEDHTSPRKEPKQEVYEEGSCYPPPPPCLWVTRGDHVSRPTMENMIPTMMMINMSTNGISTSPLIHLYSYESTKAHHIQATQSMGDGNPSSP